MLSWTEVIPIIRTNILLGVGEIVLVEILLTIRVFKNFIKKDYEKHTIEFSKNSIVYKLIGVKKFSYSILAPNMITIERTVGCMVIVPIVANYINPNLAISLYIIFSVADYVDGEVARRCRLVTPFGKKLDPFCDKLCYLTPMVLSSLLVITIIYSPSKWVWHLLASEVWGQFVIRPILPSLGLGKNVAANRIGKLKAFLCFSYIPYSFLINNGTPLPNQQENLLMICFILSMFSWMLKLIPDWKTFKKGIPKRWYANCFTTINLFCGIGAFWCVAHGFYAQVMLFILAGQIADIADGWCAKRYKGTPPWGELYDDLADFVSFGIVPARMFIYVAGKTTFLYVVGTFYAGCVLFRLVRFLLVDKEIKKVQERKKLDWLEKFSLFSREFIKKGMEKHYWAEKFSFLFFDREGRERSENIFAGLPSPATATLVMGTTLLFPSWFVLIIIFLTTNLTVGRLHFAHFAHKIFPQMKWLVAILGILLFIVVVHTILKGKFFAIAILSVIYSSSYILYNLHKYNFN